MNAQHLTTDELADAAEGLLAPERAAFAESHIADCPDCHAQSDALRAVSATLQAEPAPTMPEAVAHRLNDVVAAEQVQRVEAQSVAAEQRRRQVHLLRINALQVEGLNHQRGQFDSQ